MARLEEAETGQIEAEGANLDLGLQQFEHSLLRCIGLRQHRSSGLLHDLRAG